MSGGGCERHVQRIFDSAGITIAEPLTVKQMPTIHRHPPLLSQHGCRWPGSV
jgi:hypothetical protein